MSERDCKILENKDPIDIVQFPPPTDEEITMESFDVDDQHLGLEDQLKMATLSNRLDDLNEELKLSIISYCSNSSLKLMEIRNSLSKKMSVNGNDLHSLLIKRGEMIPLLTQCFHMIESIEDIITNFNTYSDKQEKLSQVIELILNFSNKFNQLIELYMKAFHSKEEHVEDSFDKSIEKESKSLFQKTETKNWKDEISYQVDDSERVTPVTRLDSRPLFTDPGDTKVPDVEGVKVPEFVSRYLISAGLGGPEFDPQQLLERIRTGPGYDRNISWSNKYDLLSCRPQPFLTRITLSGEFYNGD